MAGWSALCLVKKKTWKHPACGYWIWIRSTYQTEEAVKYNITLTGIHSILYNSLVEQPRGHDFKCHTNSHDQFQFMIGDTTLPLSDVNLLNNVTKTTGNKTHNCIFKTISQSTIISPTAFCIPFKATQVKGSISKIKSSMQSKCAQGKW